MGSSREAMISSLMEPTILVSMITAGLIAGTTSVPGIMQAMGSLGVPLAQPVFILIALALIIVIIAETSRIPVDDPATHLELTMVHEAMILEYS
jgi:formate hydrogenlyase subunit 4